MARRTRIELEAENLVLYRQMESIRDQLSDFLEVDGVPESEETEEGEAEDTDD